MNAQNENQLNEQREIIRRWPDAFDPQRGDMVPEELIGATINNIGTLPFPRVTEGGGLVLDYTTRDGEQKRLVLGFTELGMWLESKTSVSTDPIRDAV